MSRRQSHLLEPLPSSLTGRPAARLRSSVFADAWTRLDRVQELGEDGGGHTGCVNALCWSDDGTTLLSGSDDKRICLWTADTRADAPAAQISPHPLKLNGVIITGHRANIFCTRFLPNAGTPTIVSCAGDGDIRVFEVERLSQPFSELRMPMRPGARGALWGADGPGVRVLRCHRDRTKRIETEASPFLFLTVSEDGSVRQHDLRRPHTCRDECPPPLFQAPPRVDLYSLSVSPLTPYLFAVAGQTDCAYICDRRKPEHQSPSWGKHTRRAEQVTCVRRLALPQTAWQSVERISPLYHERHITCVKMSADNAGEVICSFAHHSTSLFSLNDSPVESSARVHHGSVVPPNPESNTRKAERRLERRRDEEEGQEERERQGDGEDHVEGAKKAETPSAGRPGRSAPKRRISSLSRPESRPSSASRQRTDSTEPEEAREARAARFLRSPPSSPPHEPGSSSPRPRQRDRRPLGAEWEEGLDEVIDLSKFVREREMSEPDHDLGDSLGRVNDADDDGMELDQGELDTESEAEESEHDESLDVDDDDVDDDDVDDDDVDEFDGVEDDDVDDDDDDDDDSMLYPNGALSAEGEFKDVDVLYPRRSFRGARNVETVKSCNFLGDRSDKIASGSDDGNWFVWDKETGRVDGIWRGDGDIVNVTEQHPMLPVVAVSGIDNTVKIFAPPTRKPDISYNRTAQASEIIERNIARRSRTGARESSMFADVSAIQLLANLLRHQEPGADGRRDVLELFRSIGVVRIGGEDEDEDEAMVGPQRDSEGEGEGDEE